MYILYLMPMFAVLLQKVSSVRNGKVDAGHRSVECAAVSALNVSSQSTGKPLCHEASSPHNESADQFPSTQFETDGEVKSQQLYV